MPQTREGGVFFFAQMNLCFYPGATHSIDISWHEKDRSRTLRRKEGKDKTVVYVCMSSSPRGEEPVRSDRGHA